MVIPGPVISGRWCALSWLEAYGPATASEYATDQGMPYERARGRFRILASCGLAVRQTDGRRAVWTITVDGVCDLHLRHQRHPGRGQVHLRSARYSLHAVCGGAGRQARTLDRAAVTCGLCLRLMGGTRG